MSELAKRVVHPSVEDAVVLSATGFEAANETRIDHDTEQDAQAALRVHTALINFTEALPKTLGFNHTTDSIERFRRLQAFTLFGVQKESGYETTYKHHVPEFLLGAEVNRNTVQLLLGTKPEADTPKLYTATMGLKTFAKLEGSIAAKIYKPATAEELTELAKDQPRFSHSHDDPKAAILKPGRFTPGKGFNLHGAPELLQPHQLIHEKPIGSFMVEKYVGQLAVAFELESEMSSLMNVINPQDHLPESYWVQPELFDQ